MNTKEVSNEPQLVQMRFQPKTMQRISNLTEITGNTNRTQLIANSVEITEELLKSIKQGSKIYIEKKDGSKEVLRILGM
jgi:hypothetical protein